MKGKHFVHKKFFFKKLGIDVLKNLTNYNKADILASQTLMSL